VTKLCYSTQVILQGWQSHRTDKNLRNIHETRLMNLLQMKLAISGLSLIAGLARVSIVSADDVELSQTYATKIKPLIAKTCGECHGKSPKDNDLDLTGFDSAKSIISKTQDAR
jgi:hypothetical protein